MLKKIYVMPYILINNNIVHSYILNVPKNIFAYIEREIIVWDFLWDALNLAILPIENSINIFFLRNCHTNFTL